MSNRLFEKGREGFLDGTCDWDTNSFKCMLVSATATTAIKLITAASNASNIAITSAAHGYSNGDIVVVGQVGGNLAANGLWKIANITTNTFELTTLEGVASTGSAAYTSGGYAVNLTLGQNLSDVSGALVGAAVAIASPTVTNGVADAADVTFTAVSGAQVIGAIIYKDTGTAGTSRLVAWIDGKQRVVCNTQAAASATSVFIEKLAGGIPSATGITFSDGALATLSSLGSANDRVLTVSALAAIVHAGATADVTTTSSNLPVTPNGGNITISWDNTTPTRIFIL